MTEFSDEPAKEFEVVFLLAADIALQEIYSSLENIREGRGDEFLVAIAASSRQLQTFSSSGCSYHKQYRRLLIDRHRYGMIYSIEGRRIMVAAIVSSRRDPKSVRRMLDRL